MKTLIFLKPFNTKNPTLEEQNDFTMREVCTEVECKDLGRIYNNEVLHGKDLAQFIRNEVAKERPDWIVAEGACATVALGIMHQKKVLLNPHVATEDLNNIPERTGQTTFGFFDDRHEQHYERFQTVYPHAAWFPQDNNLSLFTIKEAVESIIETEEW